jgi:beta-aspartyl-peptidase (threonine type)
MESHWKLVIHGGAGVIERINITPEQESVICTGLETALNAGVSVLDAGGSALDAVEASVRALEDNPSFNAARGAVFTHDGRIELDAAIMDGRDRSAGAVAGVTTTRNPVSLARAVMERTPHVFLSGAGADQFAGQLGLERVPQEWFETDKRRQQLEKVKSSQSQAFDVELKYGTVGAVALDSNGHVAAATSTGGLTGKRWGRIGDTPVIGAGTYADDRSAAVSGTGTGEMFIRAVAGHQLGERVRLSGESLQQALDATLADIADLGGSGGLIAVTPDGQAAWGFTTPGMYRGMADATGKRVALYSDSEER